jgi:peptide chain release factor 1
MNEKIEELKKNTKLLEEAGDPEFKALIEEEIVKLTNEIVPSNDADRKNAIIEIRGGTGGEEAELFAAELGRMYLMFIEKKGWKSSILDNKQSSIGGTKGMTIAVAGDGAYGILKYEGGVHRVQRVPKTEKSGRLHTSAATVVVMPEVEAKQIDIRPEDLRIDVYHASGHGGQSVNTTNSAVRITHLPTGIVVTSQDERSQLKNKDKAMKVLYARVWQAEEDKRMENESAMRQSMVRSGDRSDKIRTYNFPQDRVTDHRIPKSYNQIVKIMDGGIGEVDEELREIDQKQQLEEILAKAD